jgi:5-methylcytosine-specific restriction endonuclease McrA
MQRAAHECYTPGCHSTTRETHCEGCRKDKSRAREVTRKDKRKVYNDKRWKLLVERILVKQPFCVCTAEYCGHPIPCNKLERGEIDHITPLEHGGEPFDEENCQHLCTDCHRRKTAYEDSGIVNTTESKITVVCGPPGAGKTTYALKQFKAGDLLIDYDQLMRAMTGVSSHWYPRSLMTFGWEARDAVLKHLESGCPGRAWIIDCGASRYRREEYRRRFNARVIVIEMPADECLNRIGQDKFRDQSVDWVKLVSNWWAEYEKAPADEAFGVSREGEGVGQIL